MAPFTTKSFIFDFLFCYSFSFGLLIIIIINYDVAVYLMSLKFSYLFVYGTKIAFLHETPCRETLFVFCFCFFASLLPIYFWFMAKCTFTE